MAKTQTKMQFVGTRIQNVSERLGYVSAHVLKNKDKQVGKQWVMDRLSALALELLHLRNQVLPQADQAWTPKWPGSKKAAPRAATVNETEPQMLRALFDAGLMAAANGLGEEGIQQAFENVLVDEGMAAIAREQVGVRG